MAARIAAPPEMVETLRTAVERHGVRPVARALGMSDATAARLAGGLPVMPGTILIAERRMAEVPRGG